MNIILWIIFGALAGWIASLIAKTGGNAITDIIIGILGAVIGGWIMSLFGQPGTTGFNLYSLIVAIIGALILISVVRAIRR